MQQIIKKIKYAGQTKEVYVEYSNLDNGNGRTDTLVLKSNNIPSEEFDCAFWNCQGVIEKVYFPDVRGKFKLTELVFDRKDVHIPNLLHYNVKAKGIQWNHEANTSFSFDTGLKECYFYEALHNAEGKYTGKNKEFSPFDTVVFNRMIELAVEYINGRGLQAEMFDEIEEEMSNQEIFDRETKRLKPAFDAIGKAIDAVYEHGQKITKKERKRMTEAQEYEARQAGAVFEDEEKSPLDNFNPLVPQNNLDELDLFPPFEESEQ